MSKLRPGRWIQLAGILLMMMGVGIEALAKAHLGYIIITTGSLVFAVGTKMVYFGRRNRRRRKRWSVRS